ASLRGLFSWAGGAEGRGAGFGFRVEGCGAGTGAPGNPFPLSSLAAEMERGRPAPIVGRGTVLRQGVIRSWVLAVGLGHSRGGRLRVMLAWRYGIIAYIF